MRMWNVEASGMCSKHLLGEHVEMHMFVGTLNKNKSIEGYINKGLVEVHNIRKRHNNLVREMKARGMNHRSPLPGFKTTKKGKVNVHKNKEDLINRCKECKKRNGNKI